MSDKGLWHRALDPTPWTALYVAENGYTQILNAKGEPVMDLDPDDAVYFASRELAEFIVAAVNGFAGSQTVDEVQ